MNYWVNILRQTAKIIKTAKTRCNEKVIYNKDNKSIFICDVMERERNCVHWLLYPWSLLDYWFLLAARCPQAAQSAEKPFSSKLLIIIRSLHDFDKFVIKSLAAHAVIMPITSRYPKKSYLYISSFFLLLTNLIFNWSITEHLMLFMMKDWPSFNSFSFRLLRPVNPFVTLSFLLPSH